MWLFLLFVGVPIIEITLFIQVGGFIGLFPTLAVVVLTAFVGTTLMRRQGIMTLQRLQNTLAEGQNPADPIAQGAMILVAGVLLLTPGFFTDAVGLALLFPPVRVVLFNWAKSRIIVGGFSMSSTGTPPFRQGRSDGDTIDGEYTTVDGESDNPPDNPSGWAKHE